DRMLLSTPGNNDLWDVLLTIYGKEIAKGLTAVEAELPTIRVAGYIGQPETARSNRLHEHVMVNGRYVRSRTLQHAIEEAYRNVIAPRRYPLVALCLTIDPEYVDANVHPAKTEVRFRNDSEVHQAVLRSIRRALAHAAVSDTVSSEYEPITYERSAAQGAREATYVQERLPEPEVTPTSSMPSWTAPEPVAFRPQVEWSSQQTSVERFAKPTDPTVPSVFPPVRVISQLSGTYILAQAVDAWLIIDQHAAHERILYEQFKAELTGGQISTQMMMVPLTLELTSFELERMRTRLADLEHLGYVIEPFGTGTVLVRGIPQVLGEAAGREALIELMDEILHCPKAPAAHELVNKALITMSCKGAIKANQWLPVARQDELIQRLSVTPDCATCPHGRPTYWWLSHQELDKHFLRS
ncbi:MAG: DNA mismatch repair endonuclease MutL, partial [Bacillota bacterium]